MEFVRALIVWFAMLVAAIANGALREGLVTPRLGTEAAHAISSVTLSLAVLLIAVVTIDWLGPRSNADAWRTGFVWLVLTLAFEFLAGHFAFKKSWADLFADYDLSRGRIWILVLIVTLVSPVVALRLTQLRHLKG